MKKLFWTTLVLAHLCSIGLLVAARGQLQAPKAIVTVEAVIKAHPEINTCDDESLTAGRAAIVDWTAQRLNKAQNSARWGRKSRGRVVDGKADRPNTDALTYLRDDGKFEIYDVIGGGGNCGATWGEWGPYNAGENGYWAPPQLGPEGSAGSPPAAVEDPAPLKARIAELEAQVATLGEQLRQVTESREYEHGRADDLYFKFVESERQLAEASRQRDELANRPAPGCRAKVPGWASRLGLRVGCEVVQ